FDGRPMCGVLDATARPTEMIVLGYREATARTSSVLLPVGAPALGHKMHQTVVTPRAAATPAWSWPGGPPEGFVWRSVHASYLALHWAGNPAVASRFVAALQATRPAPSAWSRTGQPATSPPPVFTIPPSGLTRPAMIQPRPGDELEDDIPERDVTPFVRPVSSKADEADEAVGPVGAVGAVDVDDVDDEPSASEETVREPSASTSADASASASDEASEEAPPKEPVDDESPTEVVSSDPPTEVVATGPQTDRPDGPTSGGPTGGDDGDGKRPASEAA